jgi:hypothetical protein
LSLSNGLPNRGHHERIDKGKEERPNYSGPSIKPFEWT